MFNGRRMAFNRAHDKKFGRLASMVMPRLAKASEPKGYAGSSPASSAKLMRL